MITLDTLRAVADQSNQCSRCTALSDEIIRLREEKAAKITILQADLARVTAERDELEAECERRAVETGLLRRERDALAKRVAELTAQRDTAYGYG